MCDQHGQTVTHLTWLFDGMWSCSLVIVILGLRTMTETDSWNLASIAERHLDYIVTLAAMWLLRFEPMATPGKRRLLVSQRAGHSLRPVPQLQKEHL